MPAQLKRRLFIFLFIVALIAAGFFAHWFFKGRFYESTDNAYVQGEITRVSSQLGARIAEVKVGDNEHVEKGQLLVILEQDDFLLAIDRANATLATREAERLQATSKLTQQASLIAAADAQVSSSQATLGRAQIDLSRAQPCANPAMSRKNASLPCLPTTTSPAPRSPRPRPTCKASANRSAP